MKDDYEDTLYYEDKPMSKLIDNLKLQLDPHFEQDGRFVSLWRAVWAALPLRDRRIITAYWRANPPTVRIDDESEDWTQGDSGDAAAQCRFAGRELAFRQLAMRRMTDDELRRTIAHELAHVRLIITDPHHMADPAQGHEDVDALLDQWQIY